MYLTINSSVDINSIITITCSNNITLRKFNVKANGYGKMYMDKDEMKKRLIIENFIPHNLIINIHCIMKMYDTICLQFQLKVVYKISRSWLNVGAR